MWLLYKQNVGMKTIISNRLLRIAYIVASRSVRYNYVRESSNTNNKKKIKKKINTDSLKSYTFPVN